MPWTACRWNISDPDGIKLAEHISQWVDMAKELLKKQFTDNRGRWKSVVNQASRAAETQRFISFYTYSPQLLEAKWSSRNNDSTHYFQFF